jgi:hypothetical protein
MNSFITLAVLSTEPLSTRISSQDRSKVIRDTDSRQELNCLQRLRVQITSDTSILVAAGWTVEALQTDALIFG